MFVSFFPRPKLFFLSAILWTGLSMALWYAVVRDLGPSLSIGALFGYGYPEIPRGRRPQCSLASLGRRGERHLALSIYDRRRRDLLCTLGTVLTASLVLVVGGGVGDHHFRDLVPGSAQCHD